MSLELGREHGQSIVFPTLDVRVTVRRRRGRVRLGVEAPPHVPVMRAELLEVDPPRARRRAVQAGWYRVVRIDVPAEGPCVSASEPVEAGIAQRAVQAIRKLPGVLCGMVPNTPRLDARCQDLPAFSAAAIASGAKPYRTVGGDSLPVLAALLEELAGGDA